MRIESERLVKHRRRIVGLLASVVLVTGTAAYSQDSTSVTNSTASKPNVLFISIDDLNDWVGFLDGHPQVATPNMDRLAKRGIVFTNAHCAAPLCCPSRAAIYSGRRPFETGVYDNSQHLRRMQPDLTLLPHHLSANGYRTFGAGKLMHRKHADLCDETFFPEQRWSPFSRGEVLYSNAELPTKGSANPRHVIAARDGRPEFILPLNRMPSDRRPNDRSGESFDWGPFHLPDSEFGDGKIATWACEKLGQDHDRPFFLAVGFYRPHIPLYAPAKYFQSYPVESIELPPILGDDLNDLGTIGKTVATEAVTAGSHATTTEHGQWKAAVASYLACVSFVDFQIGRLLDALDSSEFASNTIIVLWSDHGWHLGEKQHWGKSTGWERSTRVPLIIAPPQSMTDHFAIGESCHNAVSLVDLYPTLVEMCELPSPQQELTGKSLAGSLLNPRQSDTRAVISTFGAQRHAIRNRRHRLIRYEDGSIELYDLQADPNEWHNIADSQKDIADALLISLQDAVPAQRGQ